ncbi:MAG: S-layer homology domain-containing protein [Thermoleophilia bacterium]
MKRAGKNTMTVVVATAALTLALSGVALASPMGTGGATAGTMMGTTDTQMTIPDPDTMAQAAATMAQGAGTMAQGSTYGPGSMMDGTTEPVGGSMGTDSMGSGRTFSDVAPGEWYEHYAQQMADHDFMGGFADGTFGGYQTITRGQFAGVMARMMGLEPADGSSFSDTAGFWGAGAIQTLAQNGIVAGYANGAFGPYDDITRAQMATLMDRAWQWMGQNGMGSGMDDADMTQLREEMRQRLHDVQGSWAEDHIAHMFGLGVLQGDESGMFRPQATTTRAQASAMMWRWYEALQQ